MVIRKLPLEQLRPAPFNPRVDLPVGDPDYEDIKASIVEFGPVEPLIFNERSGFLISGHQRLKILKELGYEDIEVVVVCLSPQQERLLNLAMNKVRGRWDDLKLADLLEELCKEPNIDLNVAGFDLAEISEILDEQRQQGEDEFDVEAAVAAIKEPVTQPGDLIHLGPHRLLCGDSSNFDDVKKLMGDQQADLYVTDPPYNVSYAGGAEPNPNTRPKKSRRWERIYSDDMPQEAYEAWLRKVITNAKAFLKPGAAFYIWQGHRQIPPLYQILLDLGCHVSSVICWLKESATIGYGDYCFQSEHALYGWLQGARHYWAGSPGESNVWQVKRDCTRLYIHPTQKPIQLAAKAVTNSSKRGDVVLDTFMGSGSLLIACESLERRCYGLEIDARYVDAIIRRYLAFTNGKGVSVDVQQHYLKEQPHVGPK